MAGFGSFAIGSPGRHLNRIRRIKGNFGQVIVGVGLVGIANIPVELSPFIALEQFLQRFSERLRRNPDGRVLVLFAPRGFDFHFCSGHREFLNLERVM